MPPSASLIITNAQIFSADPQQPTAEALAIQGNRILLCGSAADVSLYKSPTTRVIDAGGKTLMPGFIDSHFHMLYGALNMDGMQLEAVTNYAELSQLVRQNAAEHPADAWLSGTGLRYNVGPERAALSRFDLDALVADRPIYINAFDGHTSWANSLALKMAGLFDGGECGPNSEIVMDGQSHANGELREPGAFQPVSDLVPKPDDARKRTLLQKALRLTASLGVTSVHNMDNSHNQAQIYAAMEDLGELTCRIYLPYSISPETDFSALEKEALPLKHSFTDGLLRAGSVKFFLDGVIESYTGLLVEPYADDPGALGAANYTPEHYQRMLTEADRLGLQVLTHAVGDMAVRQVLDACQAAAQVNGKRDSRHRVEHIELVHPTDLPRFKELGVLASMQPLHAPARVDEGDVWPARVGPQRWPMSFAWQSLRDAGAQLVFGSDWPVATQSALRGVAQAVNRKPWLPGLPDQHQSLTDTLLAYTRHAAYAEFQEHQKGQLKTGYLADLVLLSENIFEIPAEQLAEVQPLMTMVDGSIVYTAPTFGSEV
ncbi:MAG: amidohydrolase [Chloroflexota bacterium]